MTVHNMNCEMEGKRLRLSVSVKLKVSTSFKRPC